MTPQEKAKELVELFWTEVEDNDCSTRKMSFSQAKQCALIAVDEILSLMIKFHNRHIEDNSNEIIFWEEVKQEIEKL